MKALQFSFLLTLMSLVSVAQVGVGTTDPKASLDIAASSLTNPTNTDGLLIPKINNFPSSNPGPDQDGMMVYVTGNGALAKGFYYWDHGSTSWVSVLGSRSINDLADGKSDNDGSDNGSSIFLGDGAGNSDDETNNGNVGIGKNALQFNSSGHSNLGIGFQSMLFNTTGTNNTALGRQALLTNTTGDLNVAIAPYALYNNLSGSRNIAIGHSSLYNNQGENNVSVGINSLFNNTSGSENISVGYNSLYSATTASSNTAVGSYALFNTTTGGHNTSIGYGSLSTNSTGQNNTALGFWSGYNSTGNDNVYLGYRAGFSNTDNNRLFIENTDSNTPLIYGEFDTDIVRINGEFEIGNPTLTGYAFPIVDGTNGQVLITDGAGNVSFQDISTEDSDWYIQGGSSSPTSINDNIFTQGNVAIGNTSSSGQTLYVETNPAVNSTSISNVLTPISSGLVRGIENSATLNGTTNAYLLSNSIGGNSNGSSIQAIRNSFSGSGSGAKTGMYNFFTFGFSGIARGIVNYFDNTGIDGATGITNTFDSTNPSSYNTGVYNQAFSTHSSSYLYGNRTLFSGASVSNEAYGTYNVVSTTGTDYGVYSRVDNNSTDYAAFFSGRVSVGNDPALNRYFLPGNDGSAGQVMTTDGAGNINFQDSFTDRDWFEVGSANPPNSINDDKYTDGSLSIGKNTAAIGLVDLENDNREVTLSLLHTYDPPSISSPKIGIQNTMNSTEQNTAILNELLGDSASKTGVNNFFSGNMASGLSTGISSRFENTGGANQIGVYNTFASTSSTGEITGLRNWFQNGSNYTSFITGIKNDFNTDNNGEHTAILNTFTGTGTGIKYGIKNIYSGTGNGVFYGNYTELTNTGTANKYGNYISILSTSGGSHYGVYSDVRSAIGYAAYFIGRTSLGNNTTNRYLMPTNDGTNGQVMTTDGAGNVTFQDAAINTDNQQVDTFGLVGNTLGISLEDDGVPVQTVNLGNLSFNVNNFSLAVSTLSGLYIHGGTGYEKMAFGTIDIDTQAEYLTANRRFRATNDGYYRINATYTTTSNYTTSNYGIAVYKNGTLIKENTFTHVYDVPDGILHRAIDCIVQLDALEYVEIYMYSTLSGVIIDQNPSKTYFEVERIR